MLNLPPLTAGTIVKRYKRFLADVELPGEGIVTAHCPNTGSMATCWQPGAPALLSHSDNPRRKLPWTLECVDMGRGWVGREHQPGEPGHPGRRGARAPSTRSAAYERIQSEPRVMFDGHPPSRFDLLLESDDAPGCYVEVKNTTLLAGRRGPFPRRRNRTWDASTWSCCRWQSSAACAESSCSRSTGRKGAGSSRPRRSTPEYAETLARVVDAGVEVVVARLRHHAAHAGGHRLTALAALIPQGCPRRATSCSRIPPSHGLWARSAVASPSTEPLTSTVDADVVVVGAGFTGLSAALRLSQQGVSVAVLEAGDIGFGASGRNVGLVNAGLWLSPREIVQRLGDEYGNQIDDPAGRRTHQGVRAH